MFGFYQNRKLQKIKSYFKPTTKTTNTSQKNGGTNERIYNAQY